MDEKMQIEEITYERERLDFFTELMKLAQTRYNLLHRRFKDAPYLSEAHQTLSDMGREIHFFGDVVEMLEKGYCKPTEWISVDEDFPKVAGREYFVWDDVQKTVKKRFFHRIPPSIPLETYPYIREYFGNSADYKRYTHWMPLPEPPKGEGNES